MSNRDWSLVFFTTLAQWSVGIVLWLTWPVIYNQALSPVYETGLNLTNPILLALIFIGSATLSSLLHLGNPTNAPKALNNLSGSWLSREILAIGVFTASLAITLITGWMTGDAGHQKYLMVLSSLSGLVLLVTMSRIYVMPTIPAWNSWHTPVSFVSTALGLGLLTLLLLESGNSINIAAHIARIFWISLTSILLLEIGSGFIQQRKLAGMEAGMCAPVFDRGLFYRVFLLRMAVLVLACLLSLIFMLKPDLFSLNNHTAWIVLIFVLVVTQEVMGRLLFYSSYFRLGV